MKRKMPARQGLSAAQYRVIHAKRQETLKAKQREQAKKHVAAPVVYQARNKGTRIVGTPSTVISFGKPKVPTQTIEIKLANRLYRALQVRNHSNDEWGTVNAEIVNQHTPQSYITEIDRGLQAHMEGWRNNGHFGPSASFRIATVPAPGATLVY